MIDAPLLVQYAEHDHAIAATRQAPGEAVVVAVVAAGRERARDKVIIESLVRGTPLSTIPTAAA